MKSTAKVCKTSFISTTGNESAPIITKGNASIGTKVKIEGNPEELLVLQQGQVDSEDETKSIVRCTRHCIVFRGYKRVLVCTKDNTVQQ